jgi:hypothetical protein
VLRPIHRLALETLPDVRREMSRLYRGGLNGRVPASQLTKFVFVLDKIRSCLEAEAAQAAATKVDTPIEMRIVSIPAGVFVKHDEEMSAGGLRVIEHQPAETMPQTMLEGPDLASIPTSTEIDRARDVDFEPAENARRAELEKMSTEQLIALVNDQG